MQIQTTFDTFKIIAAGKNIYWVGQGNDGTGEYTCVKLFVGINPNAYSTSLETSTDILNFKTNIMPLSTVKQVQVEGDGMALAFNDLSILKDSDGRVRQVVEPRTGSEAIYATHNFCDKSTWYSESLRALNETLTNSGDGLTWNSLHANWIDMITGRLLDDDGLIEDQQLFNPLDPHGYSTIIKINGVVANICDQFTKTGGDYWINFEDGKVVFLSSQAGKTITASYSYATTSVFVLQPLPGKILNIEAAEADFSNDIVMNDEIYYTVLGYVDVFAPQLMPGVPSGTKIPLFTNKYKRYTQILREAIGSFPTLTANASLTADRSLSIKDFRLKSRGSKVDSISIPFRYGTVRQLSSSAGMELRVGLTNNNKFDGETSTLTFYAISKDE